MDRVHLVLVPGFAGFDALGQLEYYAGVTRLFQKWRAPAESGRLPVLHYFDNFPTAGVCTRAHRLREYLAKRIARGEFARGDELVLVGHSTGGLDIRRLIGVLAADASPQLRVDGGAASAVPVPDAQLLDMITGVAFLSVPQWGTNIADWVRARRVERWMAVTNLRAIVAGATLPLLDTLENAVSGLAAIAANSDILLAMHDTLAEADACAAGADALRVADAHESGAMVALWLRHMAWDFAAIDDLACAAPDGNRESPAHMPWDDRVREAALWNDGLAIRTRSYVTIGRPPATSENTDLTYRLGYGACSAGPFEPPALGGACTRFLDPAHEALVESWTHGAISASDNDGIVNTASMVWRANEDVVLVPGDHMDIVGHHMRVPADGTTAREWQAYDLLRSDSGFDVTSFAQVWDNVFAWALRPNDARTEAPRPESRLWSILAASKSG